MSSKSLIQLFVITILSSLSKAYNFNRILIKLQNKISLFHENEVKVFKKTATGLLLSSVVVFSPFGDVNVYARLLLFFYIYNLVIYDKLVFYYYYYYSLLL